MCLKTIHVDVFSGNMMQIQHSVALNFVQGSAMKMKIVLQPWGRGTLEIFGHTLATEGWTLALFSTKNYTG